MWHQPALNEQYWWISGAGVGNNPGGWERSYLLQLPQPPTADHPTRAYNNL